MTSMAPLATLPRPNSSSSSYIPKIEWPFPITMLGPYLQAAAIQAIQLAREIITGFQMTCISKSIIGQVPLALVRSFLSLRQYQRFSPFRILSNGMATLPRNSTLWSRSSSYTVTSSTEFMSFTLLQ